MENQKIKLKNGGYLEITPEQKARWQAIYKNVNVEEEIENIINCYNNFKVKRQSAKGTLKYINFYLKNLNEFYGG